jgi:hypothetical protein
VTIPADLLVLTSNISLDDMDSKYFITLIIGRIYKQVSTHNGTNKFRCLRIRLGAFFERNSNNSLTDSLRKHVSK